MRASVPVQISRPEPLVAGIGAAVLGTAIHRSALERLQLDRLAKRYEFENDLLVRLNILRAFSKVLNGKELGAEASFIGAPPRSRQCG